MTGRKCKATKSTNGEPCGNWALVGLEVCRFHGGSTAKARAVNQAERARRDTIKFGARPDTTAIQAFAETLSISLGMVRWIEHQLAITPAALSGLCAPAIEFTNPDDGTHTIGNGPALLIQETETLTNGAVRYSIKANPLLDQYRAERQHLATLATKGIQIGLTQIQLEAFMHASETARQDTIRLINDIINHPDLTPHQTIVRAVIQQLLTTRTTQTLV